MLISICIPHYNRSRYLLAVLDSIATQRYPELEVVISDDCSTDDSSECIPAYIQRLSRETQVTFRYIRQRKNLGFDGNTRAALAAGRGEYLFLLGNDDALADDGVIARLALALSELNFPAVAFCNYSSFATRENVVRRALATRLLGGGPGIAVKVFRSFSFMSGIVYERRAFMTHNTDAYDGSIYAQIYLACRIIAAGGTVAAIDDPMVAKDVVVDNHTAVDFCKRVAEDNRRIAAHTGGLDQVARVVCEAIMPFVPARSQNRFLTEIYRQIYVYTYPYWLYRYRRDGIPLASLNLVLGCWPPRFVYARNVPALVYVRLLGYYLMATFVGMGMPIRILDTLKAKVYRLAKTI